jgi:carboxypeptidase C (cathepsin A)
MCAVARRASALTRDVGCRTDPVILWLNGGPGSSSLIGMYTENGPLVLNEDSLANSTVPTLFANPFSWTKVASVIYVESPAGVGFSYCNYAVCLANDTSTAIDNHEVLKAFFAGYPEFSTQEFYITGALDR